MYSAQVADAGAAESYAEGFTLEGVSERVAQPLLVIHGRHDAVLAWEDALRSARRAPRGEFKLYDDGNTVCSSVSALYRPYLADWIRERL